jgi:hypothetical protein
VQQRILFCDFDSISVVVVDFRIVFGVHFIVRVELVIVIIVNVGTGISNDL